MDHKTRYEFSPESRKALECLPHAIAAYQFVDGKVVTLLVTDGFCQLANCSRALLMQNLDSDMFGKVHPDDVERLATLGYSFATKEGIYDVIYRSRMHGSKNYRTLHVVGKYQTMEDGSRVAFLSYTDLTDTPQHQLHTVSLIESPKGRFLDDSMGAMAIVSRRDQHLIYYNKALARLIAPKQAYDSAVTFQQFFFGKDSNRFDEIFYAADSGPLVFDDPVIPRKLEISVITTTYADEPVYAVYVFAFALQPGLQDDENQKRRARASFNASLFVGESNALAFYENGYRGFHVWNLTKDLLVLNASCELLCKNFNVTSPYDSYVNILQSLDRADGKQITLGHLSRERLLLHFESGSYPREETITFSSEHGIVSLSLRLTMMRSPDSGDVFLKVQEFNITHEKILEMLVDKTVEQEYDYVAYSDLESNICHIISGKTSASGKQHYSIKTTDFINSPSDVRTFSTLFPSSVQSLDDMHRYLVSVCDKNGCYRTLQELPGGALKTIYFELVDSKQRAFYIRCKDVTNLLRSERERKLELESAAKDASERAERLLLQTILFISNALDARDPITRSHSQRVARYSTEIARRLGWEEERLQNLYTIALLHDIGKIGVPDAVLQKCGKLTHEEYLQIQDHVAIGGFILKDFTAIDKVAEGALYHHERYDGRGYPRGLVGEEIPIEARIICVADAVDAMNSTRPYRERQSEDYIRNELTRERRKQFDPKLAAIMLTLIDDGILTSD